MTDAYGTLTRRGERPELRFRRRLAHPPEAVWRALTEPDQLERWFPTTIDGERVAGAALSFSHRDVPLPPFDGEMLAYDPPRLLALRWGEDELRFELEPDGEGGTVLTLTDTIGELGKAARDGAGWHVCLDMLGEALGAGGGDTAAGDRWRAVHSGYVERFGPAASSIGPPQEWEDAHGS